MQGSGNGSIGEPLGVENGLTELRPQPHAPEGLYIASTLIQDHWDVSTMVLNVTRYRQELRKGSPFPHCEPVALMTPPNVEQPQVQDSSPMS
jgi:hypothetical protein